MTSRKKSRVVLSESSSSDESSSAEERDSSSSQENDSDTSNPRSSKKRSKNSKSTKSTKSTKKASSNKRRKTPSSSRKSRMSWMADAIPMEAHGFDALLQLASASTALDEGRATAESIPVVAGRKERSTKSRDATKPDRSNEKKRKTSRKPRNERETENESRPVTQPAIAVSAVNPATNVRNNIGKPVTSPEQQFAGSSPPVPHPMMMMQGLSQMPSFASHGQYVPSINEMGQVTFVNPNVNDSLLSMAHNAQFVSQNQTPQYGVTIHPNGQQYALVGLNHMGQFSHNPQQQIMQQRHFVQPHQFALQQPTSHILDNAKQTNNVPDSSINNPSHVSLFPATSSDRANIGPLVMGQIAQSPKGPLPIDRKLCSRHVAIAYLIFHNQRSNGTPSDRSQHDPTLEARRLKERAEWARRGMIAHIPNPSAAALVPSASQQPADATNNNVPTTTESIMQRQLAVQLQLAAANPALMQQMLQQQQRVDHHQHLQLLAAASVPSIISTTAPASAPVPLNSSSSIAAVNPQSTTPPTQVQDSTSSHPAPSNTSTVPVSTTVDQPTQSTTQQPETSKSVEESAAPEPQKADVSPAASGEDKTEESDTTAPQSTHVQHPNPQ